MANLDTQHETYPIRPTSPIGNSRVAALDESTGDVVVPADLSILDLAHGPTLSPEEFGFVPEVFPYDEIGAIGLGECIEADRESTASPAVRTVSPPVIIEVYDDGRALTAEGDIVYLDPDSDFIPDPVEARNNTTELIVHRLRAGGWTELANKFESLGIGLIDMERLDSQEFREHVAAEEFGGYLFSLMRLNGDMRIAYRDIEDQDLSKEDFLAAYRLFLGKNASADNSELSVEAQRIVDEEDAHLRHLTRRRGDRRREEIRLRCERYIDKVCVVEYEGRPVLMAMDES